MEYRRVLAEYILGARLTPPALPLRQEGRSNSASTSFHIIAPFRSSLSAKAGPGTPLDAEGALSTPPSLSGRDRAAAKADQPGPFGQRRICLRDVGHAGFPCWLPEPLS